ncbi:MAG: MOSC domain-containing protein [Vulcanimicrobiota bacterium]
MSELKIHSLAVGEPVEYDWGTSGICKHPVDGPLQVQKTGIEGDGQADLKHHGGPDKVACCYPLEHYPYWSKRLGRELSAHAFGENFSLEGATEDRVCVGDIYRCGTLLLQVSQPRRPCWKLARFHDQKELTLWAQESGKTGWYVRVLEPGPVESGARLTLAERPYPRWTISLANQVIYAKQPDPGLLEEFSQVEALSESWQENVRKKLVGQASSDAERLTGDS